MTKKPKFMKAIFKLKNGQQFERMIPVNEEGNPAKKITLSLHPEEISGEGKINDRT